MYNLIIVNSARETCGRDWRGGSSEGMEPEGGTPKSPVFAARPQKAARNNMRTIQSAYVLSLEFVGL